MLIVLTSVFSLLDLFVVQKILVYFVFTDERVVLVPINPEVSFFFGVRKSVCPGDRLCCCVLTLS